MYSHTLDSQCKNVDKNEHNNDCLRAALRVGGRRGLMWKGPIKNKLTEDGNGEHEEILKLKT